jgi:hypothetical protein
MKSHPLETLLPKERRRLPVSLTALFGLFSIAVIIVAVQGSSSPRSQSARPAQGSQAAQSDGLTAAEFSRLSHELSEDGGFFRSDNFTSNETPYLTVVDKLRQLTVPGGAYVGVGPEQNFTYIAKLKPRIVFIVDIRRQAIIQHLMFKAVFQLSADRVQFLSRLLSKPLPKTGLPGRNVSAEDLVAFIDKLPADDQTYAANLAEIRRVIEKDALFPLNEKDRESLDYVYRNFKQEGLEIAFRMDGSRGGFFPTLKDLIVQTDLHGKPGNFLADPDDYEFVRNLQRKNLVIPVVGDFGGPKALAGVGDYLRKNGYVLSGFYTSNVEQYLFEGGSFPAFANNVRHMPINDKSLFIRSASGRYMHPARLPGHRSATILERISLFLKDFDEGKYQSYNDLITSHYIAADSQ